MRIASRDCITRSLSQDLPEPEGPCMMNNVGAGRFMRRTAVFTRLYILSRSAAWGSVEFLESMESTIALTSAR